MLSFEEFYKKLNAEQRAAVDSIDGPLLVLAGPGTGKTQLLSTRVANILRSTDTLPQNILCLTFTEAAALNMRQRLISMIGDTAYDVQIGTYHSFASEIIRSYPDFFVSIDMETGEDTRLERPINELGQIEIISSIINDLPFSDPLRSARYYLRSVLSTISDLKKADISPDRLSEIAKANQDDYELLSPKVDQIYGHIARIPAKDKALPLFEKILKALDQGGELAQAARIELEAALSQVSETNSTKPLTAWKNKWLHRDESGKCCFTDNSINGKLISLANIYRKYQEALELTNQYDFNDMILKTLKVLQEKPDLKYNLQERYQYILLDEFQDTNIVQFELVKQLADHPVNEGRPNIMAVGDDDQGIFSFQGADIGNMVQFLSTFRDVKIISLSRNYRSHDDILQIASNVAQQIDSRLHYSIENISKNLISASRELPENADIIRREFGSQAAEYGWIADDILRKIKQNTKPEEITILAPKHSILEGLIPFLNNRNIPVTYEKRENIFDAPLIQSLMMIIKFLEATNNQDVKLMDELLPKVLSLEFWQIPVENIWKLNWEHSRLRFSDSISWCERALKDDILYRPTKFLLKLASVSETVGLEVVLDYISGSRELDLGDETYISPLKSFYFSKEASGSGLKFYEALSHLSVIRSLLRDQQSRNDDLLKISDLTRIYQSYTDSEQPLINTHPIAQSESSVVLQTVYKAKGLEYEHVYLPLMHNDVWGDGTRTDSNKISLPENLKHIRHTSSGEDNLRRLLFVAITRSKHGLAITSHLESDSGRKNMAAKYMLESGDGQTRTSNILPEANQQIIYTNRQVEELRLDIDDLWHTRHSKLSPQLRSLLSDRLSKYVMSPTHLNNFTNLEYHGPFEFLLTNLLRFPQAPSPDSIYGDVLHKTLEKYQKDLFAGNSSSIDTTIDFFKSRINRSYLTATDKVAYIDRGAVAIRSYLSNSRERLETPALVEYDFSTQHCNYKGAMITGKIDRLEIDKKSKTLKIIDFKSGKPSSKWSSSSKHLGYKQQLYFYILLAETSIELRGYQVEQARLEFIEPLPNGEISMPLILNFKEAEYQEFKKLISKVWELIQNLDLPDVSKYPSTYKGTKDFIANIVNEL